VQRNVIRALAFPFNLVSQIVAPLCFLSLRPRTKFLTNPRCQIEVSSTSKDTAPEHELGSVNDHPKDVQFWLEDWLISATHLIEEGKLTNRDE